MFSKLYDKIKKFIKNNYKLLIIFIILIFVFYFEFPYVIYKSGGTINLEDRVDIDTNYKESGSISMSYVTSMKATIPFILASYVLPDWDLIPLDTISNGESYNEVLEQGKVYLNEGIDNAIISAFRESDYNIEITNTINHVIYLSKEANTKIKVGDIILKVDDYVINSLDDVKTYINTLNEGDIVKVLVKRNNKELEADAKVYKDIDGSLKIGVAFNTTYEYKTEVPVTIKMKDNESGSSGSLMMSLAIYNALTKDDITKGLNIVGTGSINSDGTVDEIGGVKYKVLAAEKKKADIFFCPEENYEEAKEVKDKRNLKVKIVSVSSLKDTIDYLKNYNK